MKKIREKGAKKVESKEGGKKGRREGEGKERQVERRKKTKSWLDNDGGNDGEKRNGELKGGKR